MGEPGTLGFSLDSQAPKSLAVDASAKLGITSETGIRRIYSLRRVGVALNFTQLRFDTSYETASSRFREIENIQYVSVRAYFGPDREHNSKYPIAHLLRGATTVLVARALEQKFMQLDISGHNLLDFWIRSFVKTDKARLLSRHAT